MIYFYHGFEKYEKTSHATTNMAIILRILKYIQCTNETIQCRYNIAQCKELCYSIMLIKHQANSSKFIQEAFLFLRVRQYPLIEQSAECRLDVSFSFLVSASYS